MKHDVERIRDLFPGTRYRDFDHIVKFEPVGLDHPEMDREFVAKQRHFGYWTGIQSVEDFLYRFRHIAERSLDERRAPQGKYWPCYGEWPLPLLMEERELREWGRSRVDIWMERRVRPRPHAVRYGQSQPKAYQFPFYVERLIETRDWRAREIAAQEALSLEIRGKPAK